MKCDCKKPTCRHCRNAQRAAKEDQFKPTSRDFDYGFELPRSIGPGSISVEQGDELAEAWRKSR